MALSGSFQTTGYNTTDGTPDYATFSWTGTQSIEGNYTDISWSLTVGGGKNGYYWNTVYNRLVKINDTQVGSGSSSWKVYNGTVLLSGTTRVAHNDDGTGSFKAYAGVGFYSSGVYNSTKTETFTLDAIPRHPDAPTISSPTTATVSETSESITVSWSATNRGTYTLEVSKNGGAYSVVSSGIAIDTLSYSHAIIPSQRDTYRYRVKSVWNNLSSDYTYSGTVTLNYITAPTVADIATYNPFTGDFKVNITGGSQANGQSFYRQCHIYHGWTSGNPVIMGECARVANSTTALTCLKSTLQSTMLSVLDTTAYTGTNFQAVCWNENDNGTRSDLVVKNFTVNINTDGGATPTLAIPKLSGGTLDYPETCFVVGITNLAVTSGSAATRRAPSGTTLTYTISCTGATTASGSSATFNGLTAGKKTITVTVTDSRGLKAQQTVYCRFQSWAKPTVKITKAERDSSTPTTINVEYSVTYSPIYAYSSDVDTAGTQLNAIHSQQYATGSNYATCTSPFSITGVSEELTRTITVRASDKVNTTDYGSASKAVGTSAVYIASRSHGIGLNCIPASGYRLEVNGKARIGSVSGGNVIINNGYITSDVISGSFLKGNTGYALINSTATAGSYTALAKMNSTNGYFTLASYTDHFRLNYTDKSTVDAGDNTTTKKVVLLREDGTSDFAFSIHEHDYLPLSGGTLTGQLLTSFKSSVAIGSYGASASTVPNLVEELRYSSGAMGSVSIDTTYTSGNVTIASGWYNFVYTPHRSGGSSGAANGDNHNYGTLLLYGMTVSNAHYRIRIASGSITEVARVLDTSYVGEFTSSKVLYSNAAGTTGTVSLSDSAANYKMIVIIAGFSDTGASGSLVVYAPDGKTVDVGAVIAASSSGAVHRVRYVISGTTMTPSNNYEAKFINGTPTFSTTGLCCKAVLGFK